MDTKKIQKLCNFNNIIFIQKNKVSSTMDIAQKINNLDNKILFVISKFQTKGRGRLGNKWFGKKGNIFFTLKIYSKKNQKSIHELGMLTSLLIVQTIKKFVKNKVFLKWPNDIFIDNKKVGGVLVENNIENNNNYCLIGVGINFLSSPVL